MAHSRYASKHTPRALLRSACQAADTTIYFSRSWRVHAGTVFVRLARTYYLAGCSTRRCLSRSFTCTVAAFVCWVLLLVTQTSWRRRRVISIAVLIAGFLLRADGDVAFWRRPIARREAALQAEIPNFLALFAHGHADFCDTSCSPCAPLQSRRHTSASSSSGTTALLIAAIARCRLARVQERARGGAAFLGSLIILCLRFVVHTQGSSRTICRGFPISCSRFDCPSGRPQVDAFAGGYNPARGQFNPGHQEETAVASSGIDRVPGGLRGAHQTRVCNIGVSCVSTARAVIARAPIRGISSAI